MPDHNKHDRDDQLPRVPLLHGPQTDEERARETRDKAEREDRERRDSRDERLTKAAEAQATTAIQQHRTNKCMAVFSFILVIVSVFGNYIAWRASSAAKESADAATSAAKLASDTLTEMKSSSRIDERPYVYVSKMTLMGKLKAAVPLRVAAECTNAGRTPGIKAHVCADIAVLGNVNILGDNFPCPNPVNPRFDNGVIRSEAVIGPNTPPFILTSPDTTISDAEPKGAVDGLLASGRLRVYFYGEITYHEMIDPAIIHSTKFCGVYEPAKNTFNLCEHHNIMD